MPEKQERSRLQQYLDAGKEVAMPEVSARHVLEYLFEIGPTHPGAMGNVGLPLSEILAWQELTGIELGPWEVRTIRSASLAYAEQQAKSQAPTCPSPEQVIQQDPEQVAKHIKSILRG